MSSVSWLSGIADMFCCSAQKEDSETEKGGTSGQASRFTHDARPGNNKVGSYADEDDFFETESRGWRCSGRKIAIVIVIIVAVGAAVGGTVAGVGPEKVAAFFNKPMSVMQGVTQIAVPVVGGLLLIGLLYHGGGSAIMKGLKATIERLRDSDDSDGESRTDEKEKEHEQQVDKTSRAGFSQRERRGRRQSSLEGVNPAYYATGFAVWDEAAGDQSNQNSSDSSGNDP